MTAARPFVSYPFERVEHAPVVPALAGGIEPIRHPVVIVGGGIAGLTVALGLAAAGVRSLVLEADAEVCTGSRAICFSRRTLEILARLGADAPFLSTGLAWSGGRSHYRADEVLHFTMPHDAGQRLPPMINLQQYYAEQFLVDAARRTGLVELRWQTRVESVETGAGGVTLGVATPDVRYRVHADWVVGTDGARSRVRDAAALPLEGTKFEGRYVVADVRLKSRRPTERLAWFDPPSNPGSTILMHRQPDDVWRIDYQLLDHEDPVRATEPESVIPRIESHLRWIGESDDWAPVWISLYRANALTAPAYRRGRLLVAGDAAHLVPIFGVRGANSAFADADNLAWKLALVVRGIADERLLDSYSEERVHAARENLAEASKSTEFMCPPSYGFELMRDAVLGLAVRHPWVRSLINPRQTHAVAYPGSSLNGPTVGTFDDGPAPGAVAPDAALGTTHLSTMFAPAFTLLEFGAGGAPAPDGPTLRALAAAGLPLVRRVVPVGEEGEGAAAAYGAKPGARFLLRPDGHVLGRWQAGEPADVDSAIARVLAGAKEDR
jgi:3-(3-hydroxy-phenyl)propionate hydroxylase